eukprot:comp11613_c0_seq1/m.6103 comp11613_c0_seq1/g.6103  ORF comp11613_c0_seq1/g.6103 comp11613_c0_seq1/m.6103 type:complete len:101 (-) comp11613_c0_seq1:51-353(-)
MSAYLRSTRLASRLVVRGGHGHGHSLPKPPHYQNGFLFNEKPLKAGEKRQWEAWEAIWVFGMFGAMAYSVVGTNLRPDTSLSLWAREELKRRAAAASESS